MKTILLSLLTCLLTSTSAFSIQHLTWEHVNQNASNICAKIDPEDFDVLLGICTGGLPPVALFSKYLNNKNIQVITTSSYTDDNEQTHLKIWNYPSREALDGKRVLIVDDIADSGVTIQRVREILLEEYDVVDVKIATLFVHSEHCQCYPDFWAEENTEWLVFPWEVLLPAKGA